MEEIREAALAYYAAGTDEQKLLARNFFDSMDADGDGRVNLHEFISFLTERGYGFYKNPSFFQLLDSDGDGSLDFNEVIALYYMIKSRRPFCDGCGVFLKGLFFTCLHCHENGGETFDLCSACYGQKKYSHEHDSILDNYTLLAHGRRMARGDSDLSRTSSRSSNTARDNLEAPTSFNLKREKSKREKVKQAFAALDKVFSVGSGAVDAASGCSAM